MTLSLRAQSSSCGFHCKYPAIPWGPWGCATAHRALPRLRTLWPSPVAPVLQVQCVPGTTAQPLVRTRCWFNLEMHRAKKRSRKLWGLSWVLSWVLSQVLSGSQSLSPVSWIPTGLSRSQAHSSSLCSQQGSCGAAGAGFSLQTAENQNHMLCSAVSHLSM